MTTRQRHWAEAFIPDCSPSSHVRAVTQLLREQGYEVSVNDEDMYIYYMEHPLRETFSYDDDVRGEDDIEDRWYASNRNWIARFMINHIGQQTLRLLDSRFGTENSSVGSYTKMPFPKEKKHDNTNA